MAFTKTFSREEVAKHNSKGDLWVIIDAKVFDLSKFANLHPGGLNVLLDEEVAGQDATQVFYSLHRQEVLQKPGYVRLQIGVVEGEKSAVAPPQPGALSQVPYAEPTWLSQGFHSPYFKESHKKLQKEMRKFVDEVICKQPHSVHPDGQAREADGKRVSQSVVDAMAAKNLHRMRLGPGKHLKGQVLFDGIVKPEEFDYFHEMIITQELARVGVRGYGDGLLAGMVIGLPPVLNFASEELKARIVPDIFAGKKFISLAISEAFAGSDVSGIKTTATLTEDGKHWIVTGTKKWITNGHFSDYFTVGCRTEGGFTVILVERGEGVETSPIKTSYSPAAGTAYITFDNVKVPVGNTLGPRDGGLIVMLANFNHEQTPLRRSYKDVSKHLAGQIGFLKMTCTRTAQETANEAVQVFGGRAITKTGMGRFIEHYHTTVTFDSLLGGAEDVLGDLGVRQAMRKMPKDARL
ncbi:hypothetical protein FRB97_008761 [Tulasnella sp. 331]|nr:hypothetical protein FRB97_008761 [Tulasnella sp. 331]